MCHSLESAQKMDTVVLAPMWSTQFHLQESHLWLLQSVWWPINTKDGDRSRDYLFKGEIAVKKLIGERKSGKVFWRMKHSGSSSARHHSALQSLKLTTGCYSKPAWSTTSLISNAFCIYIPAAHLNLNQMKTTLRIVMEDHNLGPMF